MGITRYPHDATNIDQLIINADTAMYKVKNSGKDDFMFFNEKMLNELKEKIYIEEILRQAIIDEEFLLLYQPQVCSVTGQIISFEALLRLKDKDISPVRFIPIAEETGLIIKIGRWVIEQAIKQLSEWRYLGLELKPISVNFSTKQVNDKDFHNFLENILIKNNIDPKYIEIEITEGILLENTSEIIEFLNKFKKLGVSLVLDDFGTGYSSISYLTYIPVNKIKLDKSLSDKFLKIENAKVMDSIISLAHSLDLKITAEGIENMDQFIRLRKSGCDYIQGYLFSKPLKVNEINKIYDYKFRLK